MSKSKNVLLVCSRVPPEKAGVALDLERLCTALRKRGARVNQVVLGADPDAVLDHLADGAVAVVFRR